MVRRRSDAAKGLTAAEVRDEDVDVTFMMWLTSRATADPLDSALAPAGLDSDEFAIYSVLNAAPSITPTELARWMAAPPTTVSSYVKRFEARGHVQRDPNPADRRSYLIKLTPAGRRAYLAAAELFTPLRTRVAEGLGGQEPAVRDALVTLRTVLDQIRHATVDGTKH
jgi:DNA-binding MarR family transcriptional regulator